MSPTHNYSTYPLVLALITLSVAAVATVTGATEVASSGATATFYLILLGVVMISVELSDMTESSDQSARERWRNSQAETTTQETDVAKTIDSLLSNDAVDKNDFSAIVELDRHSRPWTFDDIPLDSGVFGELVSEHIVVDEADGYGLADREAFERALSDDDGKQSRR